MSNNESFRLSIKTSPCTNTREYAIFVNRVMIFFIFLLLIAHYLQIIKINILTKQISKKTKIKFFLHMNVQKNIRIQNCFYLFINGFQIEFIPHVLNINNELYEVEVLLINKSVTFLLPASIFDSFC